MKDKTLASIGTVHTEDLGRDAVHVAVVQATAGERIWPGRPVRLNTDGLATMNAGAPFLGIADPYIGAWHEYGDRKEYMIDKGQRFFIFLFPNTITSLRHEWTHPVLDSPPRVVSDAERWLRQFADRWSLDYTQLVAAATSRDYGEWGRYVVAQGQDLHSYEELGEDGPLFWQHLEALTGQTFEDGHRQRFVWSCTC